jgi:hypothetical protein
VLQLKLRCLEHDLALASVIPHERFVALVHASVERQVHVGVDEAGKQVSSACLDDLRVRRDLNGGPQSHFRDARSADDDHAVSHRFAAVAVDNRRPDDCQGALLRLAGKKSCDGHGAEDGGRDVNQASRCEQCLPPHG